jgi:regulator of protease activity HflC (stomatin/prohibitin superfamily)
MLNYNRNKIKKILIVLVFYALAIYLINFNPSINHIWPLIILFIIIFGYIKFFKIIKSKNNKIFEFKSKHMNNVYQLRKISWKVIAGFIIAITVLVLFVKSINIVPAGYTGVCHLFGKVRDQELSSGIHLVNPFAEVTKLDIRTKDYTMSLTRGEGRRDESDSISALTKEGLMVALDITVLYKLQEDSASEIYKTVGRSYDEVIIRPAIRSSIREIIATYEAKDIYSEKRKEVTAQIIDSLSKKILTRGIIIEDVLLRDVILPEKLADSIQEKLTAEQEAEKYNFILQKEEKEAERKIIEANAQKNAQKIINESLTPAYLRYLFIKELKDREGTIYVPISPNTGLPLLKDIK